jgi:hypothetical protein
MYQIAQKYIYHLAIKLTKWSLNMLASSTERPFKIYPNWDFWFENIPSGNPDAGAIPY